MGERLQMEDLNWREVSADSPLYSEEFQKNFQTEKDNWTLSETFSGAGEPGDGLPRSTWTGWLNCAGRTISR